MKKCSILWVCIVCLATFIPSVSVGAEETSSITVSTSTSVSISSDISSSTSTTTSESQTSLWDIEEDNKVQYDSAEDKQKQSTPDTAIINGEMVQLDPPEKATKYDADTTLAPKEELQQGHQRSARAAMQTVAMYRLYNPNSGEHFYTGNCKRKR